MTTSRRQSAAPRGAAPGNVSRRDAFTLVEVLVALGILAILLVIIVVPLRLGFDTFHIGNARANTQSALQSTLTSMEIDLRQAVYIFPNGVVGGVTDKEPYNGLPPYFRSLSLDPATLQGACSGAGNVQNFANPARIDMVLVRRDASGDVLTPLKPSYDIVSYYARRLNPAAPYDPLDNPIVMFRAEYPAFGIYQDNTASPPVNEVRAFPAPESGAPTGAVNAEIDFKRFGATTVSAQCTANSAQTNRNALWLTHNVYGEAQGLEQLTQIPAPNAVPTNFGTTDTSLYSHTLVTPRGLALEASRAYRALDASFNATAAPNEAPFVPDTSFVETDADGDGKIDRVTISLGLASFDVGAQGNLQNGQPKGTRLRATRTVDLPNIQ